MLLPQRYEFSSKSQPCLHTTAATGVVVATAKVRIFKQITTEMYVTPYAPCCCCYRKGTNFQANHNHLREVQELGIVVVATAKVRIFKQITTRLGNNQGRIELLLLPQRYEFSSKSQPKQLTVVFSVVVVAPAKVRIFKQITTWLPPSTHPCSCCCYRKGTNFQANHNK